MSIYKIEKMPNTNNGYTWLVSLWVIFIFLKLLSVFYSFFFFSWTENAFEIRKKKVNI